MTETITDSLRALLLEVAGYQVNVFEFIGGEHTSKNVMITAVKKKKKWQEKEPSTTTGNNSLLRQEEKAREGILTLASTFGIRQQKLAQWMGERVYCEDKNGDDCDKGCCENNDAKSTSPSLSIKTMPPL